MILRYNYEFYVKSCVLGLVFVTGLSACNGVDTGAQGKVLGRDEVVGVPQSIPTSSPDDTSSNDPTTPSNPNPNPDPNTGADPNILGVSCHSSDPKKICLSLRYVVYENSKAEPVVSKTVALENLKGINSIWSQCNIAFEIGEYLAVNPTDRGLSYNTPTYGELDDIRNEFESSSKLVVVTTGTWSGSLGSGAANAWTQMPGGGLYGVVLEAPVGDYANIIAHELGHYLNLDHAGSTSNVMSAVIYDSSTGLSTSQCSAARSAAQYYWKAMYR